MEFEVGSIAEAVFTAIIAWIFFNGAKDHREFRKDIKNIRKDNAKQFSEIQRTLGRIEGKLK